MKEHVGFSTSVTGSMAHIPIRFGNCTLLYIGFTALWIVSTNFESSLFFMVARGPKGARTWGTFIRTNVLHYSTFISVYWGVSLPKICNQAVHEFMSALLFSI